jgi:D-alanyl-D-alanine carboxypeptidase
MLLCVLATINAQVIPQKLDSLLTHTLDSMRKVVKCKSLSAAIQFPNNVVWSNAKGVSSEVPLVNATPNHTYLIGSVVKTITSACILQLADEKKLNLDDSLFRWVDTFKFINPNITIRQLLRHQSGIYDVLSNPQNQPVMLARKDSVWSYQNLIKYFIKPAVFKPGESWGYCNTNYMLLALIIEKATGKPFHAELRNRFFTPLGLNSFKIPAFESLPSSIAHVWIDLNGDGILDDAHTFYTTWKSLNGQAGPAGGYYATAADVTKWMRTYMRGDLLSASMIAESRQTVIAPGLPSTNYGLGLMERNFLNIKSYGHGGDLSYSASSWYFPSKDISITVLNNDSKYNSWSLVPVVTQLLRAYLKLENLVVSSNDLINNDLGIQLSPNPFADNLNLSLVVPEDNANIRLVFTNVLGEQLTTIEKNNLSAGAQTITIEPNDDLPKGLQSVSVFLNGKLVQTNKLIRM